MKRDKLCGHETHVGELGNLMGKDDLEKVGVLRAVYRLGYANFATLFLTYLVLHFEMCSVCSGLTRL